MSSRPERPARLPRQERRVRWQHREVEVAARPELLPHLVVVAAAAVEFEQSHQI
jgi:hypothetical protein